MRLYPFPLIITALLTGCAPAPKVPVESVATMKQGCPIRSADLQQILNQAAQESGWQTETMGASSLQAERVDGSRSARIAISHSGSRYYLTYLGSRGMHYDGTTVDATYNRWVRELDTAVQARLTSHCDTMMSEIAALPPSAEPLETIESPMMIETVPAELMIIQ